MNLELLESFGQNYPEEADGVLDCISLAVTAAFNKYGTLLAVGCNDGRVVIWDFMTRGISKVITSHVHPVCSVSWSRNGRKLLTASTDNTACIIDVTTGDSDHRFRFPSPILRIQYNPRSMEKLLVCPMRHPAMVVGVDSSRLVVPLEDEADTSISASFDRRGLYVYTGNSKGRVTVHRATDAKLVASFRVTQGAASTTAIKSIEFSRRGDWFLVNSADRIIRVYNSNEVLACGIDGEPEPLQKLQDLVNKTMWKKCCFSGDGEYVCAGSSRQHALYIWDKSNGNLVKILQGTKGELLLDVVWHPVRPIACSISSGVVSIWSQNQVENWSAFAPDFKELDENVEYDERESEFDDEDEDKIVANLHNRREDDLEVDVCKIEPIPAFCSSDEDEEDPDALLFLPIAPEVEDPDDSWAPNQQDFHVAQDENHPQQHHHHSKRHYSNESNKDTQASPRRKKAKTHDITLEGSPITDSHPLLSNKPHKDKSSHTKRSTGSGSLHRSDRTHSHKSDGKKHTQHSHRDKY